MRAQIAITRNGITQASSDKSPPEGGVPARRTNGDFLISLHRHVSETALVQMMRSLRALDPGFEMSLEMAGNITRHLSRQDTCLRLALRALGILERVNEPLFMSNLEIYDRKRPPTGMLSQNLLKLAELDLPARMRRQRFSVSAAAIENLVSVGQNRSMRLYFLVCPRRQTGRRRCRPPASLDEGFDSPGGRWLPSSMRRPSHTARSTTTALSGSMVAPEAIPAICLSGHAQNERPSNFRVLSTAEIGESPT